MDPVLRKTDEDYRKTRDELLHLVRSIPKGAIIKYNIEKKYNLDKLSDEIFTKFYEYINSSKDGSIEMLNYHLVSLDRQTIELIKKEISSKI